MESYCNLSNSWNNDVVDNLIHDNSILQEILK